MPRLSVASRFQAPLKGVFLTSFLLTVTLSLAGCYPTGTQQKAPQTLTTITVPGEPTTKGLSPEEAAKVNSLNTAQSPLSQAPVFFMTEQPSSTSEENNLQKSVRALGKPTTDKQQVLLASLQALLQGPSAEEKTKGLFTEIPEKVVLLGFEVKPNQVWVNFNEAFFEGNGAYSLQTRKKQVEQTVQSVYPGHKTVFLLKGKAGEAAALGGEGLEQDEELLNPSAAATETAAKAKL